MSDLISRQAVENITWEEPSYTDPLNVLTEVREKVRALPSVENKGEWRHYEGMLYCPKCGAEFYDEIMEYTGDEVPKHCPDCGTKMRGANDI